MADWFPDATPSNPADPSIDPTAPINLGGGGSGWFGGNSDIKPVMRQAVQQNPDQAAEAQKLSQQTGIPAQHIAADPKPFQDEAKAGQADVDTVASPVTRQFLSDPNNAAVAHDDVSTLTGIEQVWSSAVKQLGALGKNLIPTLGIDTTPDLKQSADDLRALGGGASSIAGAMLRAPQILTDIGNRQLDKVFALTGLVGTAEEQSAARANLGKLGGPVEFLDYLGQNEEQLNKKFLTPANQTLETQSFNALGQIAAQATMAFATGGTSAAVTGYGLVAQGLDQMDQSVQAAGKKGTNEGDIATLAGAGVTALTERYGLGMLLEKIPATTRNWFLRTLSGLATEASQEVVEQIGQNLTLWATVDPNQGIFDQVLSSGEVGGITGAIVSAILPGHAAHTAEQGKARLDQTKALMDASPLMQRDPAKLAQHFSDVAQASGVTDFYVPADKLIEVYGANAARTLGIDPTTISEALTTGSNVRFSPDQFAKSVVMSDEYSKIADDVRQNAGALTVNEATEATEAVVKKALAPKPTIAPEQTTALKEAGFTEEDIAGLSPEDVKDLVGEPAPPPEQSGKVQEANAPAVVQASEIAHEQLGLQGLFKTAEEAGMTPKQYENYLAGLASAQDKAGFRLQRRVAQEKLKQTSEQWKGLRDTERRSVEDEVNQEPAYTPLVVGSASAQQIDQGSIERLLEDEMRYDKETGANTNVTSAEQFSEIKDQLPKRTDGKRIYVAKGGVDIENAAKLHGFDRGIDLLYSLLTAEPRTARIERLTDQRMQEKHNDLGNQKKLLEAAVQETHSDQQAAILSQEVNQLAQAKKEQRIKPKDVRNFAKRKFGDFLVREAIPDKFFTSATRFGREAGKLLRKGNRAGAVVAKFRQLVQFQMAREAYEFKAQSAKDMKYLQEWLKPRKDWPDVDSAYVSEIKALLSPVNFRTDNAAQRLTNWLAKRAQEDGAVFSPETLAAAGVRQNATDMTVSDFRSLVNMIRELHAQGRAAKQAILGAEKVQRLQLQADLVTTLEDRKDTSRADQLKRNASLGKLGKFQDGVTNLIASMRRMEFLLNVLDNGVFGGMWHKTFFQPAADALAHEQDLLKEHIDPLSNELLKLDKKMPRHMKLGRSVYVPSLGQSFRIGELFGMLLNSGNVSNFTRLLEGGNTERSGYAKDWQPEDVMAAFEHLSPEHAKLAQKFWDTFEATYPTVAAIHEKERGRPPEHIQPREMTVKGVKLKGGYFPLKYDNDRSPLRGAEIDVSKIGLDDPEIQGSVFSGMTKERTGNKRAVDIRLGNIMNGFNEVAHYISHYDAVRSIQKMSHSTVLRSKLKDKMGPEFLKQLDDWIGAVATGSHTPVSRGANGFTRAMGALGRNQVSAVLAFNVVTAIKQTLGWGPSVQYLGQGPEARGFNSLKGVGRLAQGIGSTLISASNPAKTGLRWFTAGLVQLQENPDTAVRRAVEKSGVMRHRILSVEREIELRVNKLAGTDNKLKQLKRAGMWMLHGVQFYGVDMPTWIGAYNQGLSHNLTDDDAVHYADQVVRMSQGDGSVMSLSSIEREEALAPFTRLASWSFTSFNQSANNIRSVKDKGWKELPAASQKALWALIIPAIAQELLWGPKGADKDDWTTRALRSIQAAFSSTVPVAGPFVASAMGGYDPHLSVIDSLGEDIKNAFVTTTKWVQTGRGGDKAVEKALLVLADLAGLPTVQGKRTLSAADAGSDNPLDYITGVKK